MRHSITLSLLASFSIFMTSCGRPSGTGNGGNNGNGDQDLPAGQASCINDSQCIGGPCHEGYCFEGALGAIGAGCTDPSQCQSGACEDNVCAGDDDSCADSSECDSGYCHFPSGNPQARGICDEPCNSDSECYTGQTCHQGVCYTLDDCTSTADCHTGEVCDTIRDVCTFPRDTVVDQCRLTAPITLETYSGEDVVVEALLFEAGLTTQTAGIDSDVNLLKQAGYGPRGTTAGASGWSWGTALAVDGWEDTSEPGWDAYSATLPAPVGGEYDVAFRFSLDGSNWLYCDLDSGVDGEDGSENGYQPSLAGKLTVIAGPCDENPCTTPPPSECAADGVHITAYASLGECTVDGDAAKCDYAETTPVDCSVTGATCDLVDEVATCVGGAQNPTEAGALLITEIMPRSEAGSDPGEWFELYNTTDTLFNLQGCEIMQEDIVDHTISEVVVIAPGEYIVIASTDVSDSNHGVPSVAYDYGFDVAFTNGGDALGLRCGGVLIDAMSYSGAQVELGVALQLDLNSYDAILNDDSSYYCAATDSFGDTTVYGTPGAANRVCASVPDLVLDACMSASLSADGVAQYALPLDVYVYDNGLTNLSDEHDSALDIEVELGSGPSGSDPVADTGDWSWQSAQANTTPAPLPPSGEDVFTGFLESAVEGDVAYAFRARKVGATEWTVCSGVGTATIGANPCLSTSCDAAPAPSCDAGGDELITYTNGGTCVLDGSFAAQCVYDEIRTSCGAIGATCDTNDCVGATFQTPAVAGDLLLTEFQRGAEVQWLEIHNPTLADMTLQGCTLSSDAGSHTLAPIAVPNGGYVVLSSAAMPIESSAAVTVAGELGVIMTTTGEDTIRLSCDGTSIDHVVFDATFPNASDALSLQLDPSAFDELGNNVPGAWCLSLGRYDDGSSALYGSPGLVNETCTSIDACVLASALVDNARSGRDFELFAQVLVPGISDASVAADGHPALAIELGFGPTGVDPSNDTSFEWSWAAGTADSSWDETTADPAVAAGTDQYRATLNSANVGSFDSAARVSIDGGLSYTYCGPNGDISAGVGTVTVTEATNYNLFFSEYVEGSSYTKAIEIKNGGANTIDLGQCQVDIYVNGSSTSSTVTLPTQDLAQDEVFVLCDDTNTVITVCDGLIEGSLTFNGDDAIALSCEGEVLDIFGVIGEDPGTAWGSGATSTLDTTLVRACGVTEGTGPVVSSFDESQWVGFPKDTVDTLGAGDCATP